VQSTPHSTKVHDLYPGLFYPLLFHSLIIFLRQCVALDCFLVGVPTSFLGHVLTFKFGGMIYPTSAHTGIPILLLLFFSSVHILGSMYDSILGVWKNKTLSKLCCCYVILKHVVEL
jgi:hypothetical protein